MYDIELYTIVYLSLRLPKL